MNPIITNGFRAGFIFTLSVMSYLMLSKPSPNVHGLINDKAAHCIGFFALAFVMEGAFPKLNAIWKILMLVAYGMLIELVQLQLSYRHFSWWDWVADIAGVMLFQPFKKPMNAVLTKWFPK